jgi:hypothetical protein
VADQRLHDPLPDDACIDIVVNHNALSALIVVTYAFGLDTVLRIAGAALANGSISSRVYRALIAAFAVLAGIVIKIVWSQLGT